MRSSVWSRGSTKDSFSIASSLPILVVIIAVLFVGILIVLGPSIISEKLPATNITKILGPSFRGLVIGTIVMAIILVLRQRELAATIVVAAHLYADWYLGLTVIAPIMTLVLLFIFYLTRSPQFPWVVPRTLWLWLLLLVLAIFPAIRGALTLYDSLFYYPNIFFGAFLIFWLGTVVARSMVSVRHLFQLLAALGTLLAIHTIVQSTTGVFLLGSSRFDSFLASVSNFRLVTGLDVYRLGSFFVDPNWDGTFLAMMLCIPLGLFVSSSSLAGKVLYLAETFLILPALLFTYSAGAWVAAIVGILVFTAFVGDTRYRFLIPAFVGVAAIGILLLLPSQVNLLWLHATGTNELSLRAGVWQTGWRVIQAFPLTGVGLGLTIYALSAERYRVPAQIVPLAHPHNSYLELGAMAGLPVLFVFVALLLFALGQAFRNWALADGWARSLLGAGIAAVLALSINSWSINGWTLPPLAAFGWLILGVISSPLLATRQKSDMAQEQIDNIGQYP